MSKHPEPVAAPKHVEPKHSDPAPVPKHTEAVSDHKYPDAAEGLKVAPASPTPAPVGEGFIPNLQKFDDGKTPRDIGLSDRHCGALNGAGLGTVGSIRRVRDIDLRLLPAVDDVGLLEIRQKVPFEVRPDEKSLVPKENRPGEWVESDDRSNPAPRRL